MSNPPKPRLLVTGASGFLGFNVFHQAKQHYQVLGIAHKKTIVQHGLQLLHADLARETSLRNIIRETRPNAIVHLAAISDVNYCQLHPQETDTINVHAAVYLAKLAAELAIPMVFTSSDMVFDGKKGNYTENDPVNPLNHYGEQKIRAEEGITAIYPEAAICRMPLMLGPTWPNGKGLLQGHLDKLTHREPLYLFEDEYRSPLFGISAAEGIMHALANFKGLYHLGGAECMSRLQLGQLIANAFSIQEANIIPTKQASAAMPAPRPADATMNISKAVGQGFSPKSLYSELRLMAAK